METEHVPAPTAREAGLEKVVDYLRQFLAIHAGAVTTLHRADEMAAESASEPPVYLTDKDSGANAIAIGSARELDPGLDAIRAGIAHYDRPPQTLLKSLTGEAGDSAVWVVGFL